MTKEEIIKEVLTWSEEDRDWLIELLLISLHKPNPKRELLAARLAKESKLVAADSMEILREFDSSAKD